MTADVAKIQHPTTTSVSSNDSTQVQNSVILTNQLGQTTFSDQQSAVSFVQTDDDTIDGHHFDIWAKRTKEWKPEDITSTSSTALKYLSSAWKNFRKKDTEEYNFEDNEDPKKSEISQTKEKLKECWEAYGKGKVDIKDVVSMRIKTSLKDKKPDFTKDCIFYVVVKERDDKGDFKRNAKGEIKTKIITLHEGVFDFEDSTECIVVSLNVINWENPAKWTLKARTIKNDVSKTKVDSTQKTSDIDDECEQKRLWNICSFHAAKALVDATKPQDEQEKEFEKTKEVREKEAIEFAREALKKDESGNDVVELDRQQDVHEVISRSNCFESQKEEFTTETQHFSSNPWINLPFFRGLFFPTINPIGNKVTTETTILDVEVKDNLQLSLDSFCNETDVAKLPILNDEISQKPVQSSAKHTLYTKKPPFLMLKVQRTSQEEPKTTDTGETLPPVIKKDKTMIEIPDSLKLRKGVHLADCKELPSEIDFSLKGFIYHMGESPSSGHYIAYIQRNGKWYKYNSLDNDSNYGSEVTEEEKNDFDQRKKQAYMYLYTDPKEKAKSSYRPTIGLM